MSRHSLEKRGPSLLPRLLLLGAGALVTAVAWVYQVGAAIDFAELALSGVGRAWWFVGTSSLGAIVCLVLVMVLTGRALRLLGFLSAYQPRRAAKRRAGVPRTTPVRALEPVAGGAAAAPALTTTSARPGGEPSLTAAQQPTQQPTQQPARLSGQPSARGLAASVHASLQTALAERRKAFGRRVTPQQRTARLPVGVGQARPGAPRDVTE